MPIRLCGHTPTTTVAQIVAMQHYPAGFIGVLVGEYLAR